MWPDLTKPDFHRHPILQVRRFITLSRSAVCNQYQIFTCCFMNIENFCVKIAWCDIKLQLIEVNELNVYGNLVVSNAVTYTVDY